MSISRRITISVLFFSGVFTLLGTAYQLYLDYERDVASLEATLNLIERSQISSLTQDVWNLDNANMETQLTEIMNLPDVVFLELTMPSQGVVTKGKLPEPHLVVKRVFELSYGAQPVAETIPIGSLTVAITLENIYQNLKDKLVVILMTQAIKIMFVSVFIIFLFYVLVARHLEKIRAYISKTSVTSLTTPLKLDKGYGPFRRRNDQDELGVLVTAINSMRAELQEGIESQRQTEEELRQLRNYLSNIIDSMPSVLIGVDPEGVVTQWNSEAVQETGVSVNEAVGQPLSKAFPRLSFEMERVRKAIELRLEQSDPKRSHQQDGQTFYEDVTIYPLVANGIEGAVIRLDDVTEQVYLEEMMVQSEKMLSVGGLAAGMAHEINNPLAGMMQTADVMQNRLSNKDLPANQRAAEEVGSNMEVIYAFMEKRGILRMADAIKQSGLRVADIVDNMLSFARKSEMGFSSHNVIDLLDKTVELAATDYDLKKQYDFKAIKIVREFEPDLPDIPCDGSKIQQVLLNILRNGAQAMQESGTEAPTFVFRVCLDPGRGMICIEIEDNGPGMDEATRRRIFEPFFTTKAVGEGTGLGLSVSYFIITESHGGEMSVSSEPGKGTRFTIRLLLQ